MRPTISANEKNRKRTYCTFHKHANSEVQKFFAAVNHLNGPLRKQDFTLAGSKGQGL